jgi:hypothetical protein
MPNPEAPKQEVKLVLEEKDVKRIAKTIDNVITKYIEDLPTKIHNILDKLVFAALGFREDGFGRIDVDRNREAFVARLIDDRAKKTVEEALKKHEFVLGDEFDKVLRKDYAERLQRYFDNYLDRKISEHFDELMKGVLNTSELKFELKVETPKTKKDLANPNHLDKIPKLRDLILQDVVESDGKKGSEGVTNQ